MTEKVIEKLIQRQINQWSHWEAVLRKAEDPAAVPVLPIITISRELGAGGRSLAEALAARLDLQVHGYDIVEHIAQDRELEHEVVAQLDEHLTSQIDLWIKGVLQSRIFLRDEYHVALVRVVRTLAAHGGVVILGRGGNFILREEADLRLRLVAEIEHRAPRLVVTRELSEAEARERIAESDQGRRSFVEKLFHADIDDPRNYDLVINTTGLSDAVVRDLALRALRKRDSVGKARTKA